MLLSMKNAQSNVVIGKVTRTQTSETRHVTLLFQPWQLIEFICGRVLTIRDGSLRCSGEAGLTQKTGVQLPSGQSVA